MASSASSERNWSQEILLGSIRMLIMILRSFVGLVAKHLTRGLDMASRAPLPMEYRQQPALHTDDGLFSWNIQISSHPRDLKHAVALLDTQCQRGNWISGPLLDRLGKTKDMRKAWNAPSLQAANGGYITAQGQISLEWKRQQGIQFYETKFYVFPPDAINFDVILGAEYISENKLLTVNKRAMLPLLESNKNPSPGEQTSMDNTQILVQQQRASLAAKRQPNKASQANQPSQNQRQQQSA